MNLAHQFHNHLVTESLTGFATKEAFLWFLEKREGKCTYVYSDLYTLILRPLLWQGLIERTSKGHYRMKD